MQKGSAMMGIIGLFSFMALVAVGVAAYYSNASKSNNLTSYASKETVSQMDLGLNATVAPSNVASRTTVKISWTATDSKLVYFIVGIRKSVDDSLAPDVDESNAGRNQTYTFKDILIRPGKYYVDLRMVLSDGTIKEDKKTFNLN